MRTLLILCLLAPSPLAAVLVLPASERGGVRLSSLESVLLHRGGEAPSQEIVLAPVLTFDGGVPDRFAWIIPTPAAAARCDAASEYAPYHGRVLHDQLFQLARRQWADRTQYHLPVGLTHLEERDSEPTVIGPPPMAAGQAEISFHTTREAGLAPVNAWLAERGYALPADEFAWHEERDYRYVCVEFTPLSPNDDWRPPAILIGVATAQPWLPLFSHANDPGFRVEIVTITDGPLRTRDLRLAMEAMDARLRGYVNLVNLWSTKAPGGGLAETFSLPLLAVDEDTRFFVNRVEGAFGVRDRPREGLSVLDGELFLPLGTHRDEIPGFWYYGDQEIGAMERFFREHFLAATGVFAGLMLLLLLAKYRSDRRRRAVENRVIRD